MSYYHEFHLMTEEDIKWYHLQHLCFFSLLLLTIIWRCFFVFSSRTCGPAVNVSKRWRNVWITKQASLYKNKLESFVLVLFFHFGKQQYCNRVSAVCFSNVCSNRRSTSLLILIAFTAFKSKCPTIVQRWFQSSNEILLLTAGRKAQRRGKAPVQFVCLWC